MLSFCSREWSIKLSGTEISDAPCMLSLAVLGAEDPIFETMHEDTEREARCSGARWTKCKECSGLYAYQHRYCKSPPFTPVVSLRRYQKYGCGKACQTKTTKCLDRCCFLLQGIDMAVMRKCMEKELLCMHQYFVYIFRTCLA